MVSRTRAARLAAREYDSWLRKEERNFQAGRNRTQQEAEQQLEEMRSKFGDWILDDFWVVGGLNAGHELTSEEVAYLRMTDQRQEQEVASHLPPHVKDVPEELVDYIAWAKVNWTGILPNHSQRTVENAEAPFLEAADAVVLTEHQGELYVVVGVRQDGKIGLPAGFLDAGEEKPYYVAAAREFEEEAGHRIPHADRFTVGSLSTTGSALSFTGTVFNDPKRDPRNVRVVSFPSAVIVDYDSIEGKLHPGDDIAAVGLMKVSDLMKLPPQRVWADTKAIVADSCLNYILPNLKAYVPEHPGIAAIANTFAELGNERGQGIS
jgi:8-oxo-dGTP pyrophosphatase MutT (NUDIX family)